MKLISIILLISLFLPISSNADASNELTTAQINLLNGKKVTLEQYRGKKPVYLKFWATWCQPCMREMPHFQEVQTKYGNSIQVIGVNLAINDTVEDVNKVIERFGLTMPISLDENGRLAQLFKFEGSPYHLLFDKNLNLVHRGHKADEVLNNKLALLASNKSTEIMSVDELIEHEPELVIPKLKSGLSAILFTATWCDWYLQDVKSETSKNCIASQNEFNRLALAYPQINWSVVASRLWTSEADLTSYSKKYNIPVAAYLDKSNKTFLKYSVKTLPTIIIFQNGVEQYRTSELKGDNKVLDFFNQH